MESVPVILQESYMLPLIKKQQQQTQKKQHPPCSRIHSLPVVFDSIAYVRLIRIEEL